MFLHVFCVASGWLCGCVQRTSEIEFSDFLIFQVISPFWYFQLLESHKGFKRWNCPILAHQQTSKVAPRRQPNYCRVILLLDIKGNWGTVVPQVVLWDPSYWSIHSLSGWESAFLHCHQKWQLGAVLEGCTLPYANHGPKCPALTPYSEEGQRVSFSSSHFCPSWRHNHK